jgi:hypothetical protein
MARAFLPVKKVSQRQNNAGVSVTLPGVGKVLWFGLLVLCLVEDLPKQASTSCHRPKLYNGTNGI